MSTKNIISLVGGAAVGSLFHSVTKDFKKYYKLNALGKLGCIVFTGAGFIMGYEATEYMVDIVDVIGAKSGIKIDFVAKSTKTETDTEKEDESSEDEQS